MINKDEFNSLARLARLDPEDESLAGLRDDFNKILDFVNKIQELHAEGAAQAPVPENEVHNITRKDEPIQGLDLTDLANFAPEWEAGHFVVPGVLDQEH